MPFLQASLSLILIAPFATSGRTNIPILDGDRRVIDQFGSGRDVSTRRQRRSARGCSAQRARQRPRCRGVCDGIVRTGLSGLLA
jgi:hypothetical protein